MGVRCPATNQKSFLSFDMTNQYVHHKSFQLASLVKNSNRMGCIREKKAFKFILSLP